MDDTLCAANTKENALYLRQGLIALLGRGGFLLRKLCSGHLNTIKAASPDCREMDVHFELDRNEAIKTRGLLWYPWSYQFFIIKGTGIQKLREPKNSPIIKLIISFIVAAIVDTLGLINPVVVVYKIFPKQLWIRKLYWTGQLPSQSLKQWMGVYTHLLHMNEITVN